MVFNRFRGGIAVLFWFACAGGPVYGVGAGSDLAWLRDVRFIAYTPSAFRVVDGQPVAASRDSIAADLRALRPYVDGLITYSSSNGHDQIVELAQAEGFRAIILGVWLPTDTQEVAQAIALARSYPGIVRALAVGNEGLFWKRYTWDDVQRTLQHIRHELPRVALTTTEPMTAYLGLPPRLGCAEQDFLLPNIHPIFETWFRPDAAESSARFVADTAKRLYDLCGKFVLVKETGVPSGPITAGLSPEVQQTFWVSLLRQMKGELPIRLALFEAFDAPWKVAEVARDSGQRDEREGYWGWFDAQRKPKRVVSVLEREGMGGGGRPSP